MDVFYTYITIDVSMNARRFVKVWMIRLVMIFPKQHTDNAKSLQNLGGFWPCPPAHRVLLEQWGHRVAELLALYNFVLSMLAFDKLARGDDAGALLKHSKVSNSCDLLFTLGREVHKLQIWTYPIWIHLAQLPTSYRSFSSLHPSILRGTRNRTAWHTLAVWNSRCHSPCCSRTLGCMGCRGGRTDPGNHDQPSETTTSPLVV